MTKTQIIWQGNYCEEGCEEKNACFLCVEGNDYNGYYDQEEGF